MGETTSIPFKLPKNNYELTGCEIVIISCYCCRQAQQPVLFCKHFSDPEKSVQHLCNIIVITQIVCTFLLNGGMTKTDQPVPRLCYCFLYTHLSPLCPLSRCQDFFCILQGTWSGVYWHGHWVCLVEWMK